MIPVQEPLEEYKKERTGENESRGMVLDQTVLDPENEGQKLAQNDRRSWRGWEQKGNEFKQTHFVCTGV